ncbi:autotransporter assembly complex family protein [Inquilinus sp. CAU 1745]|uniref:autotransporter assembly complex protein TamA n=1 Tax=Inquilinus sp. CAU 1745 TaxID=3140369 RepID=UPI00325C0316
MIFSTLRRSAPLAAMLTSALAISVAAQQELAYEVTISEVENDDLAKALEGSSNLVALEEEGVPGGAVGLIRRTEADIERLRGALRSYGHYVGTVEATIAGLPLGDPAMRAKIEAAPADVPVPVELEVDPGPAYLIDDLAIVTAGDRSPDLPVPIDREALPLQPGDPARSGAILSTQSAIEGQIRDQGYPFAGVPLREAVVDHATEEMDVTFGVETGPSATMGEVTFEGLDQVKESFARGRIPFEVGDQYSPDRLTELRDDLAEPDVFSSIRLEVANELTPEGRLPVDVTVVEKPRRFIGFGAEYATSEGFGANAFWGHRNLFGGAERIRIDAEVGRVGTDEVASLDYRLGLSFKKPDFLRRDQNLVADFAILQENPDAYERRGVEGTIGIEREVTERLTLGAGITGELSRVTQDDETETIRLIGIPLTLSYDATDNLLDPTEGFRIDLSFTPFPSWLGSNRNFFSSRVITSAYEDFGTEGKAILAGRFSVGTLFGEERDDVPASRRFYAGGGGSIRGYDYQSVGPLDEDGDPQGGRSVVEGSLELRYRITETIGIVPFIDAGMAFEDSVPDFSEDLQIAAGIGGRYYTGFGPIRVDVAFPLNPREEDDFFAFYVSLGQAF